MSESPWSSYLSELLKAREWRPSDLARCSGVSESRISEWRTKGTPPTIANARAVAEAFDIPLVALLVGAGLLTQAEAREGLARYTVRELCDEIDTRFTELAAYTGDPEVIRRVRSGTGPSVCDCLQRERGHSE